MILSSAGSYDVDRLLVSIELHFSGQIPPSRARPLQKGGKGGKGGQGGRQHHAHVTEEAAVAAEPVGQEGDEQHAELADMDGETWQLVEQASEALSVTAQKLKHLTQNRGWESSKGQKGGKGQAKGEKGGKAGKAGKDGGKPSAPPTSSTHSYPSPAPARWDTPRTDGASAHNRSSDTQRPPNPTPPRRVHATAWEQSVGQYDEPVGDSADIGAEESGEWDAVGYSEEWNEEWGAYLCDHCVVYQDNSEYQVLALADNSEASVVYQDNSEYQVFALADNSEAGVVYQDNSEYQVCMPNADYAQEKNEH
eukprot:4641645-Amphidinium_carterae.1